MNIPVYVSLTSIFQNQQILFSTLYSILHQSLVPDRIILNLSEDPFLLDKGFKNREVSHSSLLRLLEEKKDLIELNWVENHGPYRKLLPSLKSRINEDCIIITIDDDTYYSPDFIKNLTNDFITHQCVVGYRGFTPHSDSLSEFDYNNRRDLIPFYFNNFITGKGGALYHPSFFKNTTDLIFDKSIYLETCPKGDDIWFYLMRLLNKIGCYCPDKNYQHIDLSQEGLWYTFNRHDNHNTTMVHNTANLIGYEKFNTSRN